MKCHATTHTEATKRRDVLLSIPGLSNVIQPIAIYMRTKKTDASKEALLFYVRMNERNGMLLNIEMSAADV